jgi:hypothetical protein
LIVAASAGLISEARRPGQKKQFFIINKMRRGPLAALSFVSDKIYYVNQPPTFFRGSEEPLFSAFFVWIV